MKLQPFWQTLLWAINDFVPLRGLVFNCSIIYITTVSYEKNQEKKSHYLRSTITSTEPKK